MGRGDNEQQIEVITEVQDPILSGKALPGWKLPFDVTLDEDENTDVEAAVRFVTEEGNIVRLESALNAISPLYKDHLLTLYRHKIHSLEATIEHGTDHTKALATIGLRMASEDILNALAAQLTKDFPAYLDR